MGKEHGDEAELKKARTKDERTKLELQTNLLTYSALSNGCEAAGKPFVAFESLL